MLYSKVHIMQKEQDPLNLGSLPQISPPDDDWPVIRDALVQHQKKRRFTRMAFSALAAAATVTLAVGLFINQPVVSPAPVSVDSPVASTTAPEVNGERTLDSLIALSQQMENRVRTFRTEVGGMPTDSLIYQVELEDLVAQVDFELSVQPDSIDLWSQRVNLLLDLSRLYQNQLRRDYHRMASL